MCYTSKPRTRQWRGCVCTWGGSTAAAEADEIHRGTAPLPTPGPQQDTLRPRQQTTHIAWQMCQHFEQLKLPHAESPATESGPEHIFIALLKRAWMQGDTVKRDGGEVLLPPIIPKITWRDEVLRKWVGRKPCWQGPGSSARAARGSRWPQLNTALRSLGHTHWPAAAGEDEWVNPV